MMAVLRVTRPGCHPQQCDWSCHDGKGAVCRCPCGGVNHGVGFNQAVENSMECFEWLWECLHERRCGERVEISLLTRQPLLYEVLARE